MFHAWLPWVILCAVLAFWASPFWKTLGNQLFDPIYHVPGLDKLILAVPPVVTKVTPQAGALSWQILTYSGTGVLVSGIIAGLVMGFSPVQLVKNWFKTIYIVRFPLIAIVLMLSLATLTGTSGIQGTLGLAFAATGKLFPFFSAVLGWLGVAATGSDTSANVLFGGLQVVAAQHAGFNPSADGGGQFDRRLHGQDHRHRLHRHRGGGDGLAGQRRQDPALCAAQRAAHGHAGGPVCDAAGLCLSLHPDGARHCTDRPDCD